MFKEFWQKISSAKKIAVISHLSPDGDTLGSSIAIFLTLKRMQKKVNLINFDKESNYKFNFLESFDTIKNELPVNCDLIITCDCSDLKTSGLKEKSAYLINIDHHISNTNFGDMNIVDFKPSCAMVVYDILKTAPIKLNHETLKAIYVGIAEDTRYFSGNNADSEVFQIANELISLGINPKEMTKLLNQNEPLALIRLKTKAMQSIKLHCDGKIASMRLSSEDFKQTGGKKWMTKNFASIGLSISPVEVCYILKENDDGSTKVSLRSEDIDVSQIAIKYGGGGHKNAAAFKAKSFDENEFLNYFKGQLS